jgi:NAD(P)H-hydrate epimerase
MVAITRYGLHGELLMENAGQAVYSVISREMDTRARRFVVLCGPGNNGGDGFVVARKLHAAGAWVRVMATARVRSYSGPAKKNLERLEKAGIEVVFKPGRSYVQEALGESDAIVDGLLGTGISGDLSRGFRVLVDEVNRVGKPVFSIDIPSGVDGDTGQVHGAAVRATHTITFGLPKRGNFLQPGAKFGGRLFLSPLSFPPTLVEEAGISVALNVPSGIQGPEEVRSEDSAGRVLFLLGEAKGQQPWPHHDRMAAWEPTTFARISGRPASAVTPGFIRSSSGLNSAGGREANLPQGRLENCDEDCWKGLLSLVGPDPLVVLRAGGDFNARILRTARDLVSRTPASILLSSGFVDLLSPGSGKPSPLQRPSALVLSSEVLARLIGASVAEARKNRLSLIQDWAQELGVALVLSGTTLLLALPDGRVFLTPGETSEEDVEGEEQILLGTVAAMYDLGFSFTDALRNGLFLVSVAKDQLYRQGSKRLRAHRLLEQLSESSALFRKDPEGFVGRFAEPLDVV